MKNPLFFFGGVDFFQKNVTKFLKNCYIAYMFLEDIAMKKFVLLISLIFLPILSLSQGVVINEVCSSNIDLLEDFDGDTPDWIELYNTSHESMNLKGFYLSDDIQDLEKWMLPDISIAPYSFLLIFASDKDTVVTDGTVYEYHTNFKISSSGEKIILADNNGQIEDAFKLIDKVKVSGLEKRKEKIKGMDFPLVRYPRAEEYLFEDVNVFNDRLYVLSNQKKIDSGEHIVDVYSLVDKKYQFSIFLKGLGDIKATYFSDENLYLIRKNTEVEVYQYSILN